MVIQDNDVPGNNLSESGNRSIVGERIDPPIRNYGVSTYSVALRITPWLPPDVHILRFKADINFTFPAFASLILRP